MMGYNKCNIRRGIMQEENLYDEKYQPKPFVLSDGEKTASIIIAIVVGLACVVLLGNTIFANAQENDIEGILNFIISIGVGFGGYHAAVAVAKLRYKQRIAREEELFENRKREAIPYTVCEFCGGKIEKSYTRITDKVTGGFSLRDGTLTHHTNKSEIGMEIYSCEKCQYMVRCDCEKAIYGSVPAIMYTDMRCNLFQDDAPVTFEQVKNGRLANYFNKKVVK